MSLSGTGTLCQTGSSFSGTLSITGACATSGAISGILSGLSHQHTHRVQSDDQCYRNRSQQLQFRGRQLSGHDGERCLRRIERRQWNLDRDTDDWFGCWGLFHWPHASSGSTPDATRSQSQKRWRPSLRHCDLHQFRVPAFNECRGDAIGNEFGIAG
jgi:hypothetical protein